MTHQTKKVLVTVKAYPNPSKKYKETVCVAGIDLDTGKWIRLYPIPFRDLDDSSKFGKYSIIEVSAKKSTDKRPESFKVEYDSIKVLGRIDASKNWAKRKQYLMPTVSDSLCSIIEESNVNNKSLGMFKPEGVNFTYKKIKPKKSQEKRASCYAQQSFLCKNHEPIEDIPYDFRYTFRCHGRPKCPGHDLQIIDWEAKQAYRKWRHEYKTEESLMEAMKKKWLASMCSDNHDTYFYVGNMQRFKDNFMILGVFYPKKSLSSQLILTQH